MTTDDHKSDADRVARELAALGEPALAADETQWLGTGADEHADTAVVAALLRIAEPTSLGEPLSELDRHRVWRRVAGRIEDIGARRRRGSKPGGSGSPTYRVIMAAVAMAAGVALVTRLGPIDHAAPSSEASEASRAKVQALGARAKQSLDALDGPSDGARARSLADGYAQRLRGETEATQ